MLPQEKDIFHKYYMWGVILKNILTMALKLDNGKFTSLIDPWERFIMDFADQNSYASEEIDEQFPTPLGDELEVHILFDSDHVHDKVTGRSISGVIVCVCNTPIIGNPRGREQFIRSHMEQNYAQCE
jgi:hypothetical protein